jgi:hypothetical protein
MRTYADGQLAASSADLFTAGQDANYPSAGNVNGTLTLCNTSGVTTETILVTLSRQGGHGTAHRPVGARTERVGGDLRHPHADGGRAQGADH